MIYFKENVYADGISQEILEAINVAHDVFNSIGLPNIVITSLSDGQHLKNSKHYDNPCNAVDIRGRHLTIEIATRILEKIKEELGQDYDCIYHGKSPHFHIEYDPK